MKQLTHEEAFRMRWCNVSYTNGERHGIVLEGTNILIVEQLSEQTAQHIVSLHNESLKEEECTHCYGTGKDHGDESMNTDCPSCK